MNSMFWKIMISVCCTAVIMSLFFFGDEALSSSGNVGDSGLKSDAYLDAFSFDPEELSYDGTGNLDLLEGVSLEGYSAQDLKDMVFTRIYAGDTLSEKVVQYTSETETGKVRSVRPLKLHNYTGPEIKLPNDLPEITRQSANHFGSLLMTEAEYAVDDGFGNDVREHADIRYEADGKQSALLHYTIVFENMFGDEDVAKADVMLSGVPAYLTLTDSEITLRIGESFNPADYVAEARYADGSDARSAVMCSGNVDTTKVGTYIIRYSIEGEEVNLLVNVV